MLSAGGTLYTPLLVRTSLVRANLQATAATNPASPAAAAATAAAKSQPQQQRQQPSARGAKAQASSSPPKAHPCRRPAAQIGQGSQGARAVRGRGGFGCRFGGRTLSSSANGVAGGGDGGRLAGSGRGADADSFAGSQGSRSQGGTRAGLGPSSCGGRE